MQLKVKLFSRLLVTTCYITLVSTSINQNNTYQDGTRVSTESGFKARLIHFFADLSSVF